MYGPVYVAGQLSKLQTVASHLAQSVKSNIQVLELQVKFQELIILAQLLKNMDPSLTSGLSADSSHIIISYHQICYGANPPELSSALHTCT